MGQQSFDLDRFLDAQSAVLPIVEAELAQGRKITHWMWFVFPQIAGLGSSQTSRYYALHGRYEAAAFLSHPVLGQRLRRCIGLVCRHRHRDAVAIFGSIDAIKFRSCLTLFLAVAESTEDRALLENALLQFFGGRADGKTERLLGSEDRAG